MVPEGLIWVVPIAVTAGIAAPFFAYYLLRLIINHTEIHEIRAADLCAPLERERVHSHGRQLGGYCICCTISSAATLRLCSRSTIRTIAMLLGRAPSTVSREIKRNGGPGCSASEKSR